MTPKCKTTLFVTTVVWMALVAVAIYAPSAAVMHGPRDDREAYVYSWSFQIWARAIVDGPVFVCVLATTLVLEWVGFEWFRRRQERVGASS